MINVPKYEFMGPNTTGEALKTREFLHEILQKDHQAEICLRHMSDIDLAGFNLLISTFIQAEREGKQIRYSRAQLPKLNLLADLTQFHHVFA